VSGVFDVVCSSVCVVCAFSSANVGCVSLAFVNRVLLLLNTFFWHHS
jgi:hypothetical protein